MSKPSRNHIQPVDLAPEAQLAPDLEWMLQSRQISRALLAETLLREYYPRLWRAALALLGEPSAAVQAVVAVISNAVLAAERYHGGDIDAWLFGIAWKELLQAGNRADQKAASAEQPVDEVPGSQNTPHLAAHYLALPVVERLALCASLVLEWTPGQVGAAAGISMDEAELLIWRARRSLDHASQDAGAQSAGVGAWLRARANRLPAGEEGLADILQQSLEQVNRRVRLRGRLPAANDFPVLALVLALVAGTLWAAGRFLAEPPAAPTAPQPAAVASIPTRTQTPRPSITPPPSPTSTATPVGVFYAAAPGESLAVIAASLDVSVDELRRLNRIPQGVSQAQGQGQLLLIPGRLDPGELRQATPVTPVTLTQQLIPPQIGDEINTEAFFQQPDFSTAWLDVLILLHSPLRSQSDRLSWRMQFWLSPPQFLVITGPAGDDPIDVLLGDEQDGYIAHPGAGNLWFKSLSLSGEEFDDLDPLWLIGLIQVIEWFDMPAQRSVIVAEDLLADRPVWVVEDFDESERVVSRRWIDQITGFTLRRLWLIQQPLDELEGVFPDEVIAQAVAFDIDMPQELFNPRLPWRGGYAGDPSGAPVPVNAPPFAWTAPTFWSAPPLWSELSKWSEPLLRTIFSNEAPPSDLDISIGSLALRYRFNQDADEHLTEIYARGHLLGAAAMGKPWRKWCQRSPDGLKLAFIEPSNRFSDFPVSTAGPFWLDLTAPGQINMVYPQASRVSASFAISPDSQKIAFWGCGRPEDPCGLYVEDLDNASLRMLFPDPAVMSAITWSPDGLNLAAVSQAGELIVVGAEGSGVVYRDVYSPGKSPLPWDAPVLGWGVPFPPEMQRFDECILPPEQAASAP